MKRNLIYIGILVGCGSNDAAMIEPKIQTKPEIGKISNPLYEDDESNCGALGYECVGGRTCVDSVCTPAWIEMEDDGAPVARGEAGAVIHDGKYILTGGCDTLTPDDPALATSVSYDLSNDTWGSAPSLSGGRALFDTVSADTGGFIYGGITSCYDGTAVGPGLDALFNGNNEWVTINGSNVPSPRYNTTLAMSDDSLFVFGGSDASTPYLDTGSSLSILGPWNGTTCESTTCTDEGANLSFVNDHILHVFRVTTGLLYDLENHNWYEWVQPSNTPDFGSLSPDGVVSYGDDNQRIYVLANDDSVRIYDRKTNEWVTDTSTPPIGFCAGAASTWSGTELVAWGGKCGVILSNVGGRYQPPAPTE